MDREAGPSKLLIVEDTPAFRGLYKATFGYPGSGFEPIFTSRPTEGLDYFTANQGDTHLVIVDRELPEMFGEVVAERIRKISGKRDDPYIIMVTGAEIDRGTVSAILAKGVDEIIKKPFSPIALLEVLNRVNQRFQSLQNPHL